MKVFNYRLKSGINRSLEFEKKGLAPYTVNVGLKCGHDCSYCSTGAILRCHPAFKANGVSPFDRNYAIVDPNTAVRVARDAERKRKRGMVMLCSTTDPYSPEARQYSLGPKCLDAILSQDDWSVRLLTKSHLVAQDYPLIRRHRDRVVVGITLTATPGKNALMSLLEPHASSIPDRIAAMHQAHAMGLRTYAMLCPILPDIADDQVSLDYLVKEAVAFGAEEIFVEPVNPRGNGLAITAEILRNAGYLTEADRVDAIRDHDVWSQYVLKLLQNTQQAVARYANLKQLRFLLYPQCLSEAATRQMKSQSAGVVWLTK